MPLTNLLDSTQLVNGVAILISFFVGYRYGSSFFGKIKTENDENCQEIVKEEDTSAEGLLFSSRGDYKMLLVVRNDLRMGKGKIAAQCGHAAVGAYQSALKKIPKIVRLWENSGSAKIAVKVESEAELMTIRRAAVAKNFNTCLIRDAGRTQIEPNSKTVLAIGPAPNKQLDEVTGHLKLM